jgi:hypothetical protein
MRSHLFLVGAFAACLALAAAPAAALEPQTSAGGVRWISGGVGAEEREELEAASPEYSLKAVFAVEEHTAFLADVAFTIRRSGGETVVEGKTSGPWLYVALPAGTYEVEATAKSGETQRSSVTVGDGGQKQIAFHFARGSASR